MHEMNKFEILYGNLTDWYPTRCQVWLTADLQRWKEVKFTLQQAMKAYRGNRGIPVLFL